MYLSVPLSPSRSVPSLALSTIWIFACVESKIVSASSISYANWKMFFSPSDKNDRFLWSIYTCVNSYPTRARMYLRASVYLFFSFFFLFSLSIVVNPKSTFYISRRISKRIFFGQIDASKNARICATVSTIRDFRAYCKTLRLVWLAACMHRVRARKITENESSWCWRYHGFFLSLFYCLRNEFFHLRLKIFVRKALPSSKFTWRKHV